MVCDEPRLKPDGHIDTLVNPTVIFEVLSPSTEGYDRGAKFAHYQRLESLREYVLVAQDQPRVERFARRPGTGPSEWLLTVIGGLDAHIHLPPWTSSFPWRKSTRVFAFYQPKPTELADKTLRRRSDLFYGAENTSFNVAPSR